MRNITIDSVNAFMTGNNFKCANMEIVVTGNVIMMYLHGNQIAKRSLVDYENLEYDLSITNAAGFNNRTTKRII